MGKFNRALAKETELQTMNFDDPTDSQGVEVKSPGKMHWFTVKGLKFEDLFQITTTQLFDPDGDELTYIIQADNNSLREKIINKADDKFNVKAVARCVNWFGTEFLWIPTVKGRGSKVGAQSAEKAVIMAQQDWVKVKWRNNSVGWTVSKHPGTDKEPNYSTMSEDQIIDQIFENKIIDSLDHEALIRNNN